MAKLTRFTMPVFAGDAEQTQTSVFGTMKTSPQYTTNVAESIDTSAYSNGWSDAVELGYAPFIEDMNTLQRAITYQLAYNQQEGIPEWDAETEYYIGGLVKLNTANGAQIYSSLINNNIGNLLSDNTKWKLVLDTGNNYVTTNTAQNISALKTFDQIPQIPTAASGDSSANAASTAFVANVKSLLEQQITSALNTKLAALYPVGSIYVGTQSTCPLASLISGSTWTKVPSSRVLQTSSSNHAANTTMEAGLPNITGTFFGENDAGNYTYTGAFYKTSTGNKRGIGSTDSDNYQTGFDASRSSSIYGKSTTVQPAAYIVNVWRRTA